jgi:hypothetical protein
LSASQSRKVFISYSTKDGLDWAVRTKEYLTKRGVTVFLDKHNVKYGSPGWIRIGQEIHDSQIIVVIGTGESYYSYGMTLEIDAAINLKKPVITLRHDEAKIFEILYGSKFVRFETEPELDKRCEKIVDDFDAIIQEHRTHMLRFQQAAAGGGLPSQPATVLGESTAPAPNILGLNVRKVKAGLSEIRTSYETRTVIPSLARVRRFNASQDSTKKFIQIHVSFFHPVQDFTEEQPVLLMFEVGMAIALGERNFINKHLFEKGPVIQIPKKEVTVQRIREIVSDLKKEGFQPNAMLAPLDHYVYYMQNWIQQDPHVFQWERPREFFTIGGEERLQVFWSNNYVPYNDFLIMDSRIGEWVIKPDADGQALTARISRSALYPETRVEVLAKTTVHYELKTPNGMRVLKLA